MDDPTIGLLARACRVFLRYAYPGGEEAVPASRRMFFQCGSDAVFLTPSVCQVLHHPGGGLRGYSLRLGRAGYPHLKLQMVNCEAHGSWVFSVDTHDRVPLASGDPDARLWAEIQRSNRELKERIERAWEAEGLLTFNALLRQAVSAP